MFSSLLSGGLITYSDLVEQGFTDVASHLMCAQSTRGAFVCEEKSTRRARSPSLDEVRCNPRIRVRDHERASTQTSNCVALRSRDDTIHHIGNFLEVSRSASEDRECPFDM
ncbi:unnamed protein product [Bodo saltans]|uniref:Uncharacterized protein n=1 Tax=Bodo saltans TaxID=75058 RepID=A0A0S4KFD9_BODSA|nr:unnamed protein product [Bodo saltans]|eukprot:CUI14394.1 unnamed protein product [Bodo saltans]